MKRLQQIFSGLILVIFVVTVATVHLPLQENEIPETKEKYRTLPRLMGNTSASNFIGKMNKAVSHLTDLSLVTDPNTGSSDISIEPRNFTVKSAIQSGSSEDFVDNNASDVDIFADLGVETDFNNAQAKDDNFMKITEANTSSSGSSEWLNVNSIDSTYNGWSTTGSSPFLDAQDQPTNYIYTNNKNSRQGWFDFPSTTLSGTLTVNISIYCSNDDGVSGDFATVFYITSGVLETNLGDISRHSNWQYDNLTIGSLTATQVNNLRVYFRYRKGGLENFVYIDHVRLGIYDPTNYELDFEYQWTTAEYTKLKEELAIYTGDMGSENLRVDVWDGSWNPVITSLSANNWNNVSVSSYLTSPAFTIRLKGTSESGDSTQDQWNIDTILLYTKNPPIAENLTLSRDPNEVLLPIYSNSTLYLDYDYYDPDSDPESGTEVRWYKNNVFIIL